MGAEGHNIALVGFMGSGKTTVGRILAERLGWVFVDTDTEIERDAGCDIPTLFQAEGEAAFRDRESAVVRAVCSRERQVISTGGGVVLRPENVDVLRNAAHVVWLTARPDVVVARIGARAQTRPVLARGANDLLTHVLTLLGERGPCYQASAHRVVDTSDRSPSSVVGEIIRKWERGERSQ